MKIGKKNGSLVIQSFAKINTYLNIGPRRVDGYHDLETVFREVSLHDTLHFTSTSSQLSLVVQNSAIPTDANNLVLRALILLRKAWRVKRGMNVKLEKNIPVGAGLGGGSSNAAAALMAGWILWKRNGKIPAPSTVIPDFLFDCAKKLGADVPFFLKGGNAWAGGIGEKLTPLQGLKRQDLVLVYPRVHVSTAHAYRWLDESRLSSKKPVSFHETINSFEPVVYKKEPSLKLVHDVLLKTGCGPVFMSGSGSTIVGFVENAASGRRVLHQISRRPWDTFLCHTL